MSAIGRLFRWVAIAFGVFVLALAALVIGARFSDGPIGPVAGGPFVSGESYSGPEPDWSFVRDRAEVQFQLLDPPRSRTTWIVEYAGRIYIPSGYMNSRIGGFWKQWPAEAERQGRAILRVDDVLYERTLVRVKTGSELPGIAAELTRKYLLPNAQAPDATPESIAQGALERVADDDLWIFEMRPRE